MKQTLHQMTAAVLREVVAKHVSAEATPEVCGRIKREVIQIMRSRHGVNWQPYARRIRVEFLRGNAPNITIPPELLKRTLH